jgi:carbon starvation protein CstA
MNSLTLLIAAACCFALGYRFYSAFLATKVAMVNADRVTPAHELHDGKDYVPTNRYVLFGHHFAAIVLTSAAACLGWGYLLYGNDIMTIWPMFGIANQLLAAIALAIGTTVILRTTAPKYALTTTIPLAFVFVTTLYAGWLNVTTNYLPKHAYLNAFLTAAMMVMSVIIVATSAHVWLRVLSGKEALAMPEAEEAAAEAASAGGR